MGLRDRLNEPFPFYFNSEFQNLLLGLGVALFSFGFFQIFQPFGMSDEYCTPTVSGWFSVITFVVLGFNMTVLPRAFPGVFDPDRFTLWKFELFNVWHILTVALGCALYGWFVIREPLSPNFLHYYGVDVFRTFTVGLIPLFFLTFAIRNRMLRANLREAEAATARLMSRREPEPAANGAFDGLEGRRIVIQAETQDSLELPSGAFLYAEADDNYARIHWTEDGDFHQKLMRLPLKFLEEQLEREGEQFMRVHRSFLVDLSRVEQVRGNASGYKLYFDETDTEIPVSRMKSKDVLDRIGIDLDLAAASRTALS